MKAKALLIAVFLAATNFAWQQGGLDINNAEQHMNASTWAQTQTEREYTFTEKPIDKLRSMPKSLGGYRQVQEFEQRPSIRGLRDDARDARRLNEQGRSLVS